MRRFGQFHRGRIRGAKERLQYVELINPATGAPFAEMPVSNASDIDFAVGVAEKAFASWKRTTPSRRIAAPCKRSPTSSRRHAEELVAIEAENTLQDHRGDDERRDSRYMLDQIRFFAGAARLLEGRGAAEYMAGMTSYVRREPVGVCAAVTPWNYPMMMAVWKWAPAIAARSSTMVLKPSDTTPASSLYMAELMSQVLPEGVFSVVCGDRDTGRALAEHPTPPRSRSPVRCALAPRSRRNGGARPQTCPLGARGQGPGHCL